MLRIQLLHLHIKMAYWDEILGACKLWPMEYRVTTIRELNSLLSQVDRQLVDNIISSKEAVELKADIRKALGFVQICR